MRAYLRVGRILRPHGVQGGVKLEPMTDDVSRFNELSDAFIERGNGIYEPVKVHGASVQPDAVFLMLSCAGTREQAELLRNLYLCVDRAHAVKLPKGSYFETDLIGCTVSDTGGAEYGKVTDIMHTGSADIYVVSGKRTLMFPALDTVLKNVDVEAGHITLDAGVLKEVGLFED